jgi:hypothetical protein
MIHDCQYAHLIGGQPEWLITDGAKPVCSFCHTPKNTRTVEVPVEIEDNLVGDPVKVLAPEAKRVTRTTAGK